MAIVALYSCDGREHVTFLVFFSDIDTCLVKHDSVVISTAAIVFGFGVLAIVISLCLSFVVAVIADAAGVLGFVFVLAGHVD